MNPSEEGRNVEIGGSQNDGEDDIIYDCEKRGEWKCEYCENVYTLSKTLKQHKIDKHQDELDVGCPSCERFFKSEPGMKKHHAVVHDESLVEEKTGFDCPWDDCDREFGGETAVKIHHKKAHGKSISDNIYECEWCGDEFIERKGNSGKYCSQECYGLSERRRTTRNCSHCGKEVVRKLCSMASENVFCNRECYESYLKNNHGHFNLQHPTLGSYRGPNWESQRRKALKRDHYTCQNLKCSTNTSNQKYGEYYMEVHHIVDFDEFEDYTEANKLDNLITLCRNCHNGVHYGNLKITEKLEAVSC